MKERTLLQPGVDPAVIVIRKDSLCEVPLNEPFRDEIIVKQDRAESRSVVFQFHANSRQRPVALAFPEIVTILEVASQRRPGCVSDDLALWAACVRHQMVCPVTFAGWG